MTTEEKQYLLALSQIPKVGSVTAKNLVAYCGGARQVFHTPPGMLLKIPDVGPKLVAALRQDAATYLQRAELELNYMQQQGIQMRCYSEAGYPEALKSIYNAPIFLFTRGAYSFGSEPCIAIVGTRRASDYGRQAATRFAQYFATLGYTVVSGLAYGIDIVAHRAVLEAGGRTLGVLAHGLDKLYPAAHRRTASQMQEQGALISEYMTGTEPDAAHFPERNRIISGLCEAIIVIEAAEKGGALITARLGFDQSRNVYALPGRVGDTYSAGCNRLIRDQIARLVTDPEEVLEDLNLAARPQGRPGTPRFRPIQADLSAEEQQVLHLLEQGESGLDRLSYQAHIQPNRLVSLLLTLEFKGYVAQKPGRIFSRI